MKAGMTRYIASVPVEVKAQVVNNWAEKQPSPRTRGIDGGGIPILAVRARQSWRGPRRTPSRDSTSACRAEHSHACAEATRR